MIFVAYLGCCIKEKAACTGTIGQACLARFAADLNVSLLFHLTSCRCSGHSGDTLFKIPKNSCCYLKRKFCSTTVHVCYFYILGTSIHALIW